MAQLPDPSAPLPLILPDGAAHEGTVFLAPAIQHPNITVGEYTYAHSFDPPQDWAARLAPYLYAGAPERLTIGRFCQIANGVRFITATANHSMAGVSTYPFGVFDRDRFGAYRTSLPRGSDIVVGNDCWIGWGATLMPAAHLGNGVIVGAGAVVASTVPDYAVVVGNPAKVIRMRFSDADIATLNAIAWWDWPADAIREALPVLEEGDVAALSALADKRLQEP